MNKNKDEKITIDVVRDELSSIEIEKFANCIEEIKQNNPDRHIIYKDKKRTDEKITVSVQNGNLSIDELKKLLQCIRDIEQNKPTRHINIWMNMPDKTIKELQEINDSIVPGFPIKDAIEFTNSRQDRIKKKAPTKVGSDEDLAQPL